MSLAPRSLSLSAVAIAAALMSSPAVAQQVGVSSAVNPATTGAPPGQTEKQLLVGENIVFNEHIATGPGGQTQILFVDESAISVGPNSDMTIDKFVYDPQTGAGTQALSATRGVFRYVGGKLSKGSAQVTVNTPVATIGIRGGVFVMDLDDNGQLEIIFLYGQGLTIIGFNGQTVTITRPGFGVTVNGHGAGPSNPFRASGGQLGNFINQLDGKSGGNGGATQIPTDTNVADSGVTQTVSGNLPGSVGQSQQNSQTGSGSQSPTQNQTGNNPAQNNLNTTGSQSQPIITQSDTGTGGGQPPPPPAGIAGGAIAVNTANHTNGFTGQLTPYSGATVKNGVFMATIGSDQIAFAPPHGTITGPGIGTNGTEQIAGAATVNADNTFFYADLSLVRDPSKIGFIYGGSAVNPSALAPSGSPRVLAFQIQPDAALQSPIPFVTNQIGGAIPNQNVSVSPLYIAVPANTGAVNGSLQGTPPTALQASLAISGTGASQSSLLMVAVGTLVNTNSAQPMAAGSAEGSYQAHGTSPSVLINTSLATGVDANGNSFYGKNAIEGFVLTPDACCSGNGSPTPALATATNTQTNATSTYGFVQPVLAIPAPAIASGPQTAQQLTGFAGGIMTGTQNNASTNYAVDGGIAIVTDPSTMRIAAVIGGTDPFTSQNSGVNSMALSYGSLSGGTQQGYINNNLFGALESPGGAGSSVNGNAATNANLYLVNANAVPNNPLLPSGGLCQCQYLQWGYWGGEVDSGSGGDARTDVGHINTWVAGVQTPQADIDDLTSLRATASYSGNAIGTVNNNGATYLASGTFTETYHFGTFAGNLAISNFDGHNFSGSVTGAAHLPIYGGTLSGSNLTGLATGSFFGPSAAETGGSFAVHSITGLPYQAAGVFGGKKVN